MVLDIYLKVILAVSLITLVFFGIDKARAADAKTRIPEITLLMLTALGGAPGAFLARILFNHKRNTNTKVHFSAVIYASLALQVGFYIYCVMIEKGVIL